MATVRLCYFQKSRVWCVSSYICGDYNKIMIICFFVLWHSYNGCCSVCMRACLCAWIYTCVYMCVCMCVCVCVCVCCLCLHVTLWKKTVSLYKYNVKHIGVHYWPGYCCILIELSTLLDETLTCCRYNHSPVNGGAHRCIHNTDSVECYPLCVCECYRTWSIVSHLSSITVIHCTLPHYMAAPISI